MKEWAEQFYNSDAWHTCRDSFLQSKGWLCERCSTIIDPVPAKIAHHKKYLTKANINDPRVALSWKNLEALCQRCHNKEHYSRKQRRYYFDGAGNVVDHPPLSQKKFKGDEHREGIFNLTPQARARGVYVYEGWGVGGIYGDRGGVDERSENIKRGSPN